MRLSRFILAATVILCSLVPGARTQVKAAVEPAEAGASLSPPAEAGSPFVRTEDGEPTRSKADDFADHVRDFAEDQKDIWTSPLHMRLADAPWLVPLGGLAAGLFVTDRQYSASIHQNPTSLNHYKTVSDFGIAGLVGAGVGLYTLSFPKHNEHWRETGFLAGEAALNSLLTVEALKYSFRRERPFQATGNVAFFSGGTSFPSEHAAAAWSMAGVIAHEYSGTVPRLFAYGLASAVSLSRIQARQHFPSDVLIGSALGYLISQNIYRKRHDPEVGGSAWGSPREFVSDEKMITTSFMGSPYVPLDSWIYPAMERLAALGYIRSSVLGLRPWTRLECFRLISEAGERLADSDEPDEVRDLYESLSREFTSESGLADGDGNVRAQVESVYVRTMDISGTPLTDNDHFGQTVLNDFGRPYQSGLNSIAGTSAWTTAGPFVLYARGEYQYAPSAPSLPPAALDFIQYIDTLPPNPPLNPYATINRFRVLDAYVAMNLANWQFSFGRQSLWWGPGDEGAMLFTDNAEPLNKMFRISRVRPFRLPSVLGYMGDIRMEFFLGQVAGQQFINNSKGEGVGGSSLIGQYGTALQLQPQPYLSGAKVSFKFTPNLEIGMSKTTLYGGPGNPLTATTLVKSFLALHQGNSQLGDGRSALDLTYRLPELRDRATFYVDAFQEDEVSPVNRPYKAAFQSGLYLATLPKLSKLDLRMEGGTTSPINFPTCDGCFYSNGQYLNGYTNDGKLMGTWLGRAAQGESIKGTYWLSAQRKVSLEARHRKVDRQYLPQGGTQNDVALAGDFFVRSGFRLSGAVQYERWQIPLLAANRQSNWTTSLQLGYWPSAKSK